jgi:hypothetical protein
MTWREVISDRLWRSAYHRRLRAAGRREIRLSKELCMSSPYPEEAIRLCDELLVDLARPISEEEAHDGWTPHARQHWAHWVRAMRDMCERRVVPDRSGDMLTALEATGIQGWGPLGGKLVHLETIISNLTMAVTGEGVDELIEDLEERVTMLEGEAREDVLRDLEVLRRSRRR